MVLLIKLYLPPFPFSVLPKASLSFTLESQTSVEETRQRRVEYFARYIIRVCVFVHMYLFVHGFHNDNGMVFVTCSKHCSMKLKCKHWES